MRPWTRGGGLAIVIAALTACGSPAAPSQSAPDRVDVGGPWSLDPAAVEESTASVIDASCREAFDTAPDLPVRHPDQVANARLAVVDARGHGIWHALFDDADTGSGGLCWNGDIGEDGRVRRGTRSELVLTWPESNRPAATGLCFHALITHWIGREPTVLVPGHEPPRAAFSLAGRAGDDVASIVVDVAGVGRVLPTFEDGWFLAWWPGPAEQFTVTGLDADGKRVVSLQNQPEGSVCSD